MRFRLYPIALPLALSTALAAQSTPQPTTAATAPTRDSGYIDAQGTAYITRIVPIPPDLSPEARKSLIVTIPDQAPPETLEHRRARRSWPPHARTKPGASSAQTPPPIQPSADSRPHRHSIHLVQQ
ncbi:MAG: hypothetical protein WDN23_09115 [Edaphobacter sp.]